MHMDHAGKTAIDPICGMTVDPAKAISLEVEGESYYFCCAGCRDRFARKKGLAPPSKSTGSLPIVELGHPPASGHGHGASGHDDHRHGHTHKPEAAAAGTVFTCPMHPEIEQIGPGSCPICGMDLEPKTVSLSDETEHDPNRMELRLWIAAVLSLPLLIITMAPMVGWQPPAWFAHQWQPWIELALATPVVLWCGWPLLVRGWQSIVRRSPNMFTLIAIGTLTAYRVQRGGGRVPRVDSQRVPSGRPPAALFRSVGRHYYARALGANAGTQAHDNGQAAPFAN